MPGTSPPDASRRPDERPPHRVVIVSFAPAVLLDVTGPLEVFAGANGVAARSGRALPYAIEVVAPEPGELGSTSGVSILAKPLPGGRSPAPDTLLISGGPGARAAIDDGALVR